MPAPQRTSWIRQRRDGRSRRWWLVSIVSVVVLAAGAAAVAAFIAEGSGSTTSTETTGTGGTAPVTVTASNLTDAIVPGGTAGQINVTIANPSAFASVQVSNFVVAVTGTSNTGCTSADFTVTQATGWSVNGGTPGPLPVVIPASGSSVANTTNKDAPTIALVSTAPAACENVTVNLSETAS